MTSLSIFLSSLLINIIVDSGLLFYMIVGLFNMENYMFTQVCMFVGSMAQGNQA